MLGDMLVHLELGDIILRLGKPLLSLMVLPLSSPMLRPSLPYNSNGAYTFALLFYRVSAASIAAAFTAGGPFLIWATESRYGIGRYA